jgi:hypothetical protein
MISQIIPPEPKATSSIPTERERHLPIEIEIAPEPQATASQASPKMTRRVGNLTRAADRNSRTGIPSQVLTNLAT